MLTIIGCGNPNRIDDGVGVYVANYLSVYLQNQSFNDVCVYDAGTAGIEVMFHARESDALIIVDANLSNSEPGEIFEVPGEELENIHDPGYNLHDFRWDNALYAGRKMYGENFPDDVTVFLIEAESVDFGIGLSDIVEQSANRVIELIKQRISQYNQQ